MVEELGTGETHYSNAVECFLSKDSKEKLSLQFTHGGHTEVSITLIAQGAIRGAHKIRVENASMSVKRNRKERKVARQTYKSSFGFTPIEVPNQALEATLTLKSLRLTKGLYSVYVLACGKGTLSIDQEEGNLTSIALKEQHGEQSTDFRINSTKTVTVKLENAVGTVHLDRIQFNRHETSTWDEEEKICAVIPAFNAEKTLERSVLSLVHQTLPPHTIFIIDDCSSDNTYEKALEIRKKHSGRKTNIVVRRNGVNLGPYVTKSKIIKSHLDQYVFWCLQDADDYTLSEKIATQIRGFENQNVLSCYTFGNRVDSNGRIIKNRGLDARRIYAGGMFHRELFKKIGFFEPVKFGADDEFFCRQLNMLGKKTTLSIEDPLYKAEVLESSLTNKEAKMALNTETEEISPVRLQYRNLFPSRKSYQDLFSYQDGTPHSMRVFPEIHIRMATYPKRFEVALKTAKHLYETCLILGAHLHICFNETEITPTSFKSLLAKENVHYYTPEKNLKDNGKFVCVTKGINFWVDDDLQYNFNYFAQSLHSLIRYPKNTPICLHGYNGTSTIGHEERALIHFSTCNEADKECVVAGTGTVSMWLEDDRLIESLNKITESEHTGMVDLIFGYVIATHGKKAVNIRRDEVLLFEQDHEEEENLFTTNMSRKALLEGLLALINSIHSLKPLG
jgi:glycosyltransferase involved in cell wall biosynthesis